MKNLLVITGGSAGIGKAAIIEFQQQGWDVVNISRRDSACDGVLQINADLAKVDWLLAIQEKLISTVTAYDKVSLIHCAGLLESDSVLNVTTDALYNVLQINVVACVQLTQALVPHMPAGSSVLYVGSTLGEKAVANTCSYVVSKHAMVGLMRASCQDLAGKQIHTNCICPGFTDTEMLREHVGAQQEVLDSIANGVTFGRLIQPEEIAETLYFCAKTAVINGAVIHANLGQVER